MEKCIGILGVLVKWLEGKTDVWEMLGTQELKVVRGREKGLGQEKELVWSRKWARETFNFGGRDICRGQRGK